MKIRWFGILLAVTFISGQALGASELSNAVAGLKEGHWVAFMGPPKAVGNYGISWQGTTAFWDAKHNEFQFMAKMQGGVPPQHWIYSEATHTWRSTLKKGPREPGHLWCRSFDPTTGDYYYMTAQQKINYVRIMQRAVEAGQGVKNNPWKTTSKPEFKLRTSHDEEIGYHPNLFGPGDGGLIFFGASRLSAWRKKTDTWEIVISKYRKGDYRTYNAGCGKYLPGYDRLVLGGRGKRFLLFNAGKDGELNAERPRVEKAPIMVLGSTSGYLKKGLWGKLIVHPSNDKCLIILGPMPDYKVWTNVTGGTGEGWVEEKYTHPFTTKNIPMTGGDWGAWTCGSVSTHGVVWGLAYDGKVSKSVLWKPPATKRKP